MLKVKEIESLDEVLNVFFPKTEPFTDDLYQELLEKGFNKEMLDDVKALGFGFDRSRMCFTSLG